ncbi:MAG: hypothetical protein U9P14_11695 [Gemmatimonadota bacterium]|nr:hypothetical protein [Gemmatimonadota bacterium]
MSRLRPGPLKHLCCGPVWPGHVFVLLVTVLAGAELPASVIDAPPAGAEAAARQPVEVSFCDTLETPAGVHRITLSSRFVVPGSLRLFCDSVPLPPRAYRLDPVPGLVELDSALTCQRLIATYLAWPFTFPDSFHLRGFFPDSADTLPGAGVSASTRDWAVSAEDSTWQDQGKQGEQGKIFGSGAPGEGFRLAGFEIVGSKSVSVAGGDRAGTGTVIDQNLMLELRGKLSPETGLSLRLNDQDLALQPQGRSAELRQLDEISVMLTSPRGRVTLGDYDFRLEGYRFAALERKLDGVEGRYEGKNYTIGASAALSGGTYHSLRLGGQEGRQGPYALTGKNGEPVHVLAGTERVYLDGRLLKRGLRQDYTVDYIQGTLNFTERYLIGAESRIEVDYEYVSETFKKSLYSVTGQAAGRLGRMRGYYLRESDLENSPLGQDFTPEERKYLADHGIGADSLVFSGIRYMGQGLGQYVLHPPGGGLSYFEYLGPGNGDYMVTFGRVGDYRGSYRFDPVTGGYSFVGEGLGDFDPLSEFKPPAREDRTGLAFELNPVRHLRFKGEGALLKRTVNLYSGAGPPARTAYELSAGIDTLGLPVLPAKLSVWGSESEVQEGFSFQGRRYKADFERRWHLAPVIQGSEGANHGERVQEAGTRLLFPGGPALEASYGRLLRTGGERANRRQYSVFYNPSAALEASLRHLNIHSLRAGGDSAQSGLTGACRRRDNALVSWRWGAFRPRFTLEREKRTGPGGNSTLEGVRYLELGQALFARFSPRLETGLLINSRRTDHLADGPGPAGAHTSGRWNPYSRSLSTQLSFRCQGAGSLRLSGRLGHRRRKYESTAIGRTSHTAGRIEVSSGNFAGALQSHLLYELSHGSTLRSLVRYLPERHLDEGEYLEDGTYVGKAQGTHRRELAPAEIDPRQAAKLRLTSRENLDLTSWVDSAGTVIKRITIGSIVQLERENTLQDKWKLYLMFPSALNDKTGAMMRWTRINTDLTVHWARPAVYSRLELIWNTRFDRRFQQGFEENGDRTLRLQLRVPLSASVEWDPTASVGKSYRTDLAARSSRVSRMSLANRVIANFGAFWRASFELDAERLKVLDGRRANYFKLSSGAGLTRFLSGSGRLEGAVKMGHVSGSGREDVTLVQVLGTARAGTTWEATLAASVEPAEKMLLHVRYTGRTDYFLGRFTHFGRAEIKYFF